MIFLALLVALVGTVKACSCLPPTTSAHCEWESGMAVKYTLNYRQPVAMGSYNVFYNGTIDEVYYTGSGYPTGTISVGSAVFRTALHGATCGVPNLPLAQYVGAVSFDSTSGFVQLGSCSYRRLANSTDVTPAVIEELKCNKPITCGTIVGLTCPPNSGLKCCYPKTEFPISDQAGVCLKECPSDEPQICGTRGASQCPTTQECCFASPEDAWNDKGGVCKDKCDPIVVDPTVCGGANDIACKAPKICCYSKDSSLTGTMRNGTCLYESECHVASPPPPAPVMVVEPTVCGGPDDIGCKEPKICCYKNSTMSGELSSVRNGTCLYESECYVATPPPPAPVMVVEPTVCGGPDNIVCRAPKICCYKNSTMSGISSVRNGTCVYENECDTEPEPTVCGINVACAGKQVCCYTDSRSQGVCKDECDAPEPQICGTRGASQCPTTQECCFESPEDAWNDKGGVCKDQCDPIEPQVCGGKERIECKNRSETCCYKDNTMLREDDAQTGICQLKCDDDVDPTRCPVGETWVSDFCHNERTCHNLPTTFINVTMVAGGRNETKRLVACYGYCACPDGFVRSDGGRCISPRQCEGVCEPYECRDGQKFDNIRCECVNVDICVEERCAEDEHWDWKKCQCAPTVTECSDGRVYSDCGSVCTSTCEDPYPNCIAVCASGCFCPRGTAWHEGRCIKFEECPKVEPPKDCTQDDVVYPDGSRWECDCNTCFCANGLIASTLIACDADDTTTDICSAIRYEERCAKVDQCRWVESSLGGRGMCNFVVRFTGSLKDKTLTEVDVARELNIKIKETCELCSAACEKADSGRVACEVVSPVDATDEKNVETAVKAAGIVDDVEIESSVSVVDSASMFTISALVIAVLAVFNL